MSKRVAIVGIGNLWRGDDAVGVLAAWAIAAEAGPGVSVVESDGNITGILDTFGDHEQVYIIDAVSSGTAAPGTIFEFDVHEQSLSGTALQSSTHALGIAQAIELGRALGRLPTMLRVLGIEAARFDQGVGLSQEVEQAMFDVARRILKEIKCAH